VHGCVGQGYLTLWLSLSACDLGLLGSTGHGIYSEGGTLTFNNGAGRGFLRLN